MPDKSGGLKNVQKSFKDVETLKREERNRRRLFRIEQVRQQSKEVANLVRQKVSGEREKQLGIVQERVKAKTQQWQVRKLKSLQSEYENTIQNVGKSHTDAASLPNEDDLRKIESERTLIAAQRRGQDALNRLREEEAARRRADEERRQNLLNTRAVEEARSAAVVALPKPESTVGIKSIPPKSPIPVMAPVPSSIIGKTASKNTIPEWPKKSWPAQCLPLGIKTECQNEQGDIVQTVHERGMGSNSPCKQSSSILVSSHGDSMNTTRQRNVPHSSQSSKSTQPSGPMANTSHSDVQLYDYTSCYQSQYGKISSIVEKVQEAEVLNANEAAKRELCAEKFCEAQSSIVRREQLRSKEALQRIQVQRDYKDIMGNLSMLAKQNAAISAYKDPPVQSWIQSKSQNEKLTSAVENLLQGVEASPSSSVSETPSDSPDGSLIVSQLGDTPGSAPRLNVGRWQIPNLQTEQVAPPKDDYSPTGSIVMAPPPAPHFTTITSRQENTERDSALRSLVRRINDERQSLILSQPIGSYQRNQNNTSIDKTDSDVKMLEERVFLQRQQLREQRSEVKHLNESIIVPDCMKQPRRETHVSPSTCSTVTHESITIDSSHSGDFQDIRNSSPLVPPEVLPQRVKKKQNKRAKSVVKSPVSSPAKDNMKYSLDVSLSSVVMDQTENSSSGSKSLSLHGVQVLVKLCGAGQDSSEGSSSSYGAREDETVKVVELPSNESDKNVQDDLEKEENHPILKNLKEVKHGIKKKKGKKTKEVSNTKVSKPLSNVTSKKTSKSTKIGEKQEAEKVNGSKRDDKTAKLAHEQLRAEKEKQDQPESTSTSYLSPPDRVISSLTEDIKALIALAQSNIQPQFKNAHSSNKSQIQQYINRLLAMSRESIDRLNVSCSEVSTPASAIFHESGPENESDLNLTDIGFAVLADKKPLKCRDLSQGQEATITDCPDSFSSDNHIIHIAPEVDQSFQHSESNDNATLTDMTKQCHERISALTKMIEEVRRETVVSSNSHSHSESDRSFIPNQSKSPMHFDSTTYMSPPPQVLEWADIAFPSRFGEISGMSVDPYGTAVRQLLADVQSQMIQKATDPSVMTASLQDNQPKELIELPSENRPKPPVAFWKNIERCNVSSPTEPHELSTILELGTTLPESVESPEPGFASPLHLMSRPSTPGTPPDVIAELMRRKLLTSPFVWAKQKDKQHQRSNSNSSLKNSLDSDLSSVKSGTGQSDISASKETNTVSVQSQNSSSNGSRGWKTNILMSPVDLCSSADEVEGDFRKMGIGWVGAMLRKTKEAGALSSTSGSDGSPVKIDNVDFKDLAKMIDDEPVLSSPLLATVVQGRRHSTPVKHPADHSSSSGSCLV